MKWGSLLLALALLLPFPSQAGDREEANKLFVQAARLIRQADVADSSVEALQLYSDALDLLISIEAKYPGTDLAVKIISNQDIGSINRRDIEELKAAKARLAETEAALKPSPEKDEPPSSGLVEVGPSEATVTNEAEPPPSDTSQTSELTETADIEALGAVESSTPFYIGVKFGLSAMSADDFEGTGVFTDRRDAPHYSRAAKSSEENNVPVMGLSVGYDWNKSGNNFRTEIEYMFRDDFGYDSSPTFLDEGSNFFLQPLINHQSDLDIYTLMANIFYDFNTGTKFTPYIGGGFGLSWNITDVLGETTPNPLAPVVGAPFLSEQQDSGEKTLRSTWSVMGSVSYQMANQWLFDLGYRYIDFGEVRWGALFNHGLKSNDVDSHEFLIGVRYQN